jgi:hypothetical protein
MGLSWFVGCKYSGGETIFNPYMFRDENRIKSKTLREGFLITHEKKICKDIIFKNISNICEL